MNLFENIYKLMFNKKFLSNSQSGALDIIVVKQSDDTLLCSGFHVRFGCMQTVNSEAKVEILINNQLIDSVTMEVGLDGEAYFKSYHYKNLKKIKKKSLRMNNDQL
jgi:phosphatidate phosphatase PAH1